MILDLCSCGCLVILEDVSQRSQQEGQELSNGGKRRGEAADSWFGDDSDNPVSVHLTTIYFT